MNGELINSRLGSSETRGPRSVRRDIPRVPSRSPESDSSLARIPHRLPARAGGGYHLRTPGSRSQRLKPLSILAFLSLSVSPASAQLASPGRPTASGALLPDVPQVVLPGPDVPALMAEDEARGNWPYRYGAVIATSLDCQSSGLWEGLPDGTLVWRLAIASPGARSLGLVFERFDLPQQGRLFVYDRARTRVIGAFTEQNELPNGMLALQPFPGDELVIEYAEDPGPGAPHPELRLGEVVHDYRGILERLGSGDTLALGGNCLIDVNCPVGAPYRDIQRAAIEVLNFGFNCSAAILNNTARDGTPYFLTANHCGNMTSVIAVFGYENTSCGSGGATQMNTLSGATLLRANSNFDSQLYRLAQTPPQSYEPFYAGWDRRNTQPRPAVNISHPQGLPKKIAIDQQNPMRTGNFWAVDWEVGKLEGGSSGSPLFNGVQRVIGPACCVSDFGCPTQFASFGRFNGFWNAGNLDPWLDPLGLGVTTLNGFDPFQAVALPYNGDDSNPSVYTSITPPALGTTWVAEIDTSNLPFVTSTWIVGYGAPAAVPLGGIGQLLVDTGSPRHFRSVAPVSGGLATHSNAIPNIPGLSGVVSYTQGLLIGTGSLQLTNAVELDLR